MARIHSGPCEPRDRRLLMRFRCALQGWLEAWHHQPNWRIHIGIVLAVVALGLWLQLGAAQWAILILTFVAVLSAELLNSAIEYITDLVSPDYHPLAGRAKDVAAGAVLLAACGAVIIGLLILGPPLLAVVRGP